MQGGNTRLIGYILVLQWELDLILLSSSGLQKAFNVAQRIT